MEQEQEKAVEPRVLVRWRRSGFQEWIRKNYDRFFRASDFLHPLVRKHMKGVLTPNLCSVAWLHKYRDLPREMVPTEVCDRGELVLLALAEFPSPRTMGVWLWIRTGRRVEPQEIIQWLREGMPEWAEPYIREAAERISYVGEVRDGRD
ncbi:MAG: hypothetical protein RMJ46_09120 [Bacteroidota bacterium]|nr:hypothetical protein [Bacteroidota bacterium]